ncbi:MAG: gluconate 2-dehydrogenase subunit 3 family protein [Candidatus Acidiferrum sp.]
MSWYKNLDRRQFIQLGAAAVAAGGVSCHRLSPNPWRFLTVAEARTLAAVCDQFVPPDRDPGADWARVVNFMDIQLSGPYFSLRKTYRRGLASLDHSSQAQFGKPFASLPSDQQIHLLKAMEKDELSDGWKETSPSAFFELLLKHTMQGYYGDPRHGGNRDHASWRMVGLTYPPIRGRQQPEGKNS